MTRLLLLIVPLLTSSRTGPHLVHVELLSSKPCESLIYEGGGLRHSLALSGDRLLLDGRPAEAPLRIATGMWTVTVPAPVTRTIQGSVEFRVGEGRIRIIATLLLENYVAWTVASETSPGTPLEALKAQAVVARSYALAAGHRHSDVDLCDLAHCQVLRGALTQAQRVSGERAAAATRGEVLTLESGDVAEAVFHAACGGHTANPREVFGGEGTGASAVPDDGCAAHPWRALVPVSTFQEVVRERLGARAMPEALEWRIGQGGFVVQLALADRVVGGDSFTRALDGRLGHRAIRSARLGARTTASGVLLEGTGIGHGVGLCQTGAARRAAGGVGYREILRHYFPLASLRREPG